MKRWGSSLGVLWFLLASACPEPLPTRPDAGAARDAGPVPGVCLDNDGDGVPGTGDCEDVSPVDCNDADPSVNPGAAELCNGRDENCDGTVDEGLSPLPFYRDNDGDGVGGEKAGSRCGALPAGTVALGGDCNDADPAVRPGAAEVCNGVDDNCKDGVDEGLPTQAFYPDVDTDRYGDPNATPELSCKATLPGKVLDHTDCNDANGTIRPGAPEQCNKVDDNCDGQIDNGIAYVDYYPDGDGDGFGAASGVAESSCSAIAGKVTNRTDCDDANANVKPTAAEVCNGVDDNCSGKADEGLTFSIYFPDVDGDGFGAATGVPQSACTPLAGKVTNNTDCNDADPAIRPGAAEVCNGVDDNCSGKADEGLVFADYAPDADGDGYGSASVPAVSSCKPVAGRVPNAQDCNDANAAVKPGAVELCNGVDDNCAGGVDDGLTFADYYPDADGDTFGAMAAPISACAPVAGRVTNHRDCNDASAAIHPDAVEVCNGVDDNCAGGVDDGLTFTGYYPDADGDGFGASAATAQVSCAPVPGKVVDHTDCNDGNMFIHPGAAETCNLTDDNCDGQVDNGTVTQGYYPDLDSDGYGAAGSMPQLSCAPVPGKVPNNQDCNDSNASVKPGAAELCNGADDDCDGAPDDGLTFLAYYPDLDGDGYGAAGATAQVACASVAGKVTDHADCNDTNAAVKPGAAEVCNALDDDCDGAVDEALALVSYYPDADHDGFGSAFAPAQVSCAPVSGKVESRTDCNDGNASIHPGAVELCNGVDDNCAGGADEGNPGGGASCSTSQAGVCEAGKVTCQAGGLACLRSVAPSTELCDGLDNDCDGSADEDFPSKGQACSLGIGVCQRQGSFVCRADKSGITCGATPGAPTVAACDGQDNDCDGKVDEPALVDTADLSSVAWVDLEVVPYYFSAAGCAGGATGSGSDVLAGGALVMSAGASGLQLQRLDAQGKPVSSPTSAGGLTYLDVAVAQAGDGYVVAGIWESGQEIDLYYMDAATGVRRAQLWSQFRGSNALDSLRVVRGNGRRVTLLWREATVGLRMAQVEASYDGTAWTLQRVGGGTPLTQQTLVAGALAPGLGADSATVDWADSQACQTVATKRRLGVAYLAGAQTLKLFTVLEDGTGRTADVVVRSQTGTLALGEPEVTFFRAASADHWFVAYTAPDTGSTPSEDLNYWMSTNPTWQYTYLDLAGENGADSIRRPRASATATGIQLVALRYVADASGFKRQMMSRNLDLNGAKLPPGAAVELSATLGSCTASDASCRPGNKDGLTVWAPFGRVYFSGSPGSPSGSYSSALRCQ